MVFNCSIEDDFRRAEEHVAEARRLVQRQKGPMIRLQRVRSPKNSLAAGIDFAALWGTQGPPQGKRG